MTFDFIGDVDEFRRQHGRIGMVGRLCGDWRCYFCGAANALLDGECRDCGRLRIDEEKLIESREP